MKSTRPCHCRRPSSWLYIMLVYFVLAVYYVYYLSRPSLTFSSECDIKHVHLAVGGRDAATSMTVSFASLTRAESDYSFKHGWDHGLTPAGSVRYGTDPQKMNTIVLEQESAQRYHTRDKKGREYTSPYYHHITLDGLKPETRYYYQCAVNVLKSNNETIKETREVGRQLRLGDSSIQKQHSLCTAPPIQSFVTAPAPGATKSVKMALLGDLGKAHGAPDTIAHLYRNRHDVDAVMLMGDIAYNGGKDHHWEDWFELMDQYPTMASVPWQVAAGNHDIEMTPSGELFVAYETRFKMPHVKPLETRVDPNLKINMETVPYPLEHDYGNSFYSFLYGPAHIIVLNSYTSVDPGSKQYDWFVEELESVDRSMTPWVLVIVHCPIYNTFKLHHHDVQLKKQRQYLEPLLYEHGVNAVFAGHVHAYMRTELVYQDMVDPLGPMHLTVGDGGKLSTTGFHGKEEDWLAVRDCTSYGYGTLQIFNQTHAKWEWIPSRLGNSTGNHLYDSSIPEPPVIEDSVYLYNRFYLDAHKIP